MNTLKNQSNKSVLCYFTMSYPYGEGETFIENEINFLSENFNKIFLFHKTKYLDCKKVNFNVELIYIDPPNKKEKIKTIIKNSFTIIKLIYIELFFSRQKKLFKKKFIYNFNHFINCIYYADQIKNKLKKNILNQAIFYSYWFYDWNLSLSILKKRKIIKSNYTRAHGFDLFEYNGKENYLPLRNFCLKNTDKIFLISKTGKQYLDFLYPKFSNKTIVSYLGTQEYGNNPTNKINSDILHIVSCAYVNDVKRIELIIEILNYCNKKILWSHIGDGPLFEKIRNDTKKLNSNIKINLMGKLDKNKIMEFYQKKHIDIFINTSITEGLPVSIMEAISFGIPVIATNVGGTSEIVNESTGLLIDIDFKPEIVAQIIDNWDLYIVNNFIERCKIKKFWEANFNSNINCSYLLSNL